MIWQKPIYRNNRCHLWDEGVPRCAGRRFGKMTTGQCRCERGWHGQPYSCRIERIRLKFSQKIYWILHNNRVLALEIRKQFFYLGCSKNRISVQRIIPRGGVKLNLPVSHGKTAMWRSFRARARHCPVLTIGSAETVAGGDDHFLGSSIWCLIPSSEASNTKPLVVRNKVSLSSMINASQMCDLMIARWMYSARKLDYVVGMWVIGLPTNVHCCLRYHTQKYIAAAQPLRRKQNDLFS